MKQSWHRKDLARFLASIIILTPTLLQGCSHFGVRFIRIGNILKEPARYAGQTVSIQGTVSQVLKLPFADKKLYTLRDETGEITVVTTDTAPLPGQAIKVSGKLDTIATVGDSNIGIHLVETEHWQ